MTLGIDVSRWQGDIDWAGLRAARPDIRFVFIRAGGGRGGTPTAWQYQVDPSSPDHLFGARYHGLTVGGYVPVNPPASSPEQAALEAVTYLSLTGFLETGMLVPALDIEDTTRDWSDWAADLIYYWRRLLGRRCGQRVILYSSGSFFDSYLSGAFDRDTDQTVGAWVAHHNTTPGRTPYTVGGRAILHQYTGAGTLPGIGGDVDMNTTMGFGVRLSDWVLEA